MAHSHKSNGSSSSKPTDHSKPVPASVGLPAELLTNKQELAKWSTEMYQFFIDQVRQCVESFAPLWLVERLANDYKDWYLNYRAEQDSKFEAAARQMLANAGDANSGEAQALVASEMKIKFAEKILIERVLADRRVLAEHLLAKSLYIEALTAIRKEVAGEKLFVTISETVSISAVDPQQRAFRLVNVFVGFLGRNSDEDVFLLNCRYLKSGKQADKFFYINLFLDSMVRSWI